MAISLCHLILSYIFHVDLPRSALTCDLAAAALTCKYNSKVPATGYLLDGTAKERFAGGKIQDLLCVTQPQLPIFVQATHKKASFICKIQRLCAGEITTAKVSKRIS